MKLDVHRNMPDVSGCIKWCREVIKKILKTYEMFNKNILQHIAKIEDMERINKKYELLICLLNEFAIDTYKNWSASVTDILRNNLDKNLIAKDRNCIFTNFDHQVNKHLF